MSCGTSSMPPSPASSRGDSSLGAFESAASHTTSMVLGLPVHFAIAGCAAMAAFLALVCIAAARERGRMSP